MTKKLVFFLLIFFVSAVVHASDIPDAVTGIVSMPLANVHREPAFRSGLATQVLMADEVLVLEKKDYFLRISIPSQGGTTGWIHQEAVLIPKGKQKNNLENTRQRVIVSVPKTRSKILDKTGDHEVWLYGGTRLPVVGTSSDYYKVVFPDRKIALIDKADARLDVLPHPLLDSIEPSKIAQTARQFIGVRHLAGGITAQGMDTEGLIYIVYRINGLELSAARSGLAERAERIDRKSLIPGDVLVFHGEGYGLYIGDGRFLNAVPKRSIQVKGIYDRRYSNALRHGLRLLGSDPEVRKKPKDMSADEILVSQMRTSSLPLGKRISYWASRFIGTPYDPDPLGRYVRTNRIVADDMVDCMYLTFRSAELAMSQDPSEAIEKALELRFLTRGLIHDGIVMNYDERFQYGEDMVWSGKWGRNITEELGRTKKIPGSRGRDEVSILPKEALMKKSVQNSLRDGDIVFWVKDPNKRVVQEIVGHLAIIRLKNNRPYLIHAAGSKNQNQWGTPNGGVVKEVPFAEYVANMRFIGAFITRFEN